MILKTESAGSTGKWTLIRSNFSAKPEMKKKTEKTVTDL